MKTVVLGKPILLYLCISIFLGIGLFFAVPASAYMYGEEQTTNQLIVDKKIKAINTDWQDNLPASQIVLKEGNLVEFQIKIKNSGDQELKNIKATDFLPSYLEFIFGPANPEEKEIKWQIEKLDSGQEQTFNIRAQIKGANQVASDGTFCLINKVKATAESGESDEDTASFCLMGAKKLPQAGSHNLAIGSLVAGLIGLTGITLRKFGRGEILN